MLASISPLGERARGNRWVVTASAFAFGSVLAASIAGAALGATGARIGAARDAWLLVFGMAALAASALDITDRVPTSRRQVDERWLGRYRGWVYGVGFGAQLGVGVVTVVTTATVYAVGVAAVATASIGGGLAVGAAFGAARAVPLLAVSRAGSPHELRAVLRRLTALAGRARAAAVGAAALIGLAAMVRA